VAEIDGLKLAADAPNPEIRRRGFGGDPRIEPVRPRFANGRSADFRAKPSIGDPMLLYVSCPVRRTMEINALVISGLDPGAIPGGSTNLPPGYSPESAGPISIDRRLKVLLSLGFAHRFGL
jgi:hypothetical protein